MRNYKKNKVVVRIRSDEYFLVLIDALSVIERRMTNFRESYIYSDKAELEWMQRHGHISYCYRIPPML